jgi:hypothetical protein
MPAECHSQQGNQNLLGGGPGSWLPRAMYHDMSKPPPQVRIPRDNTNQWSSHTPRNIFLLVVGCGCYSLNMKCLPQALVNAWSPAGDAISGGSGNFRRWVLAVGNRSLGVGPLGIACPWSLPVSLSASCLPCSEQFSSAMYSHYHDVLCLTMGLE